MTSPGPLGSSPDSIRGSQGNPTLRYTVVRLRADAQVASELQESALLSNNNNNNNLAGPFQNSFSTFMYVLSDILSLCVSLSPSSGP